jgi:segregation and condensation protein B
MNAPDRRLEAILYAVARPLSLKELSTVLDLSVEEVREAITELQSRLERSFSGLQLVEQGNEVELVTQADLGEDVRRALKQEASAELSKAALETLAILAYRGPLTRPEIEQVRGVQSALMLRNLLLRGLVEQHTEERLGQPTYRVTLNFFKQLGISSSEALPDYETLRHSPTVVQILDELTAEKVS